MHKIVRLFILLSTTFISNSIFAQSSSVPNDLMHSNGKIYVVVLVVLILVELMQLLHLIYHLHKVIIVQVQVLIIEL